jgi:oligopeptide transport system ATP-binding protein
MSTTDQSAENSFYPLIQVADLFVHFPIRSGLLRRKTGEVRAVDGVSFEIPQGKTVGLVGESGSGKTTVGRSLIHLIKPTAGEIFYSGKEISSLSHSEFFTYRKKIQMVFQDPFNSLNPRMTIQRILQEPLNIHFPYFTQQQKHKRVLDLLSMVGLPSNALSRYPHEFSGGQRQRIGIARALAVEPDFLILDEPVSALDVSVQAQIINLLMDLQESLNLTYLFIAHDLAVVEQISQWVLIMNRGKIVEQGPVQQVYQNPQNEYTQNLLSAVPTL